MSRILPIAGDLLLDVVVVVLASIGIGRDFDVDPGAAGAGNGPGSIGPTENDGTVGAWHWL